MDTLTLVSPPPLDQPLIDEPAGAQVNNYGPIDLGPLEGLIGTWTNQDIHGSGQGGLASPFSYNVMPLPQTARSSPEGYILKNFSYYEELTFSRIGEAANRGGKGTQVTNGLAYEQRVFFAEGPQQDKLVHYENGILLFLTDRQQYLGPYGAGQGPGVGMEPVPGSVAPTQPFAIVKQVSVPHGNSILAPGTHSPIRPGPLSINPPAQVLPSGIDTKPYQLPGVGNPNIAFTNNPNAPLNHALEIRQPSSFLTISVDSQNGNHPVSNIGFEQQHAEVTRYSWQVWLEAFGGSPDFTQIQYSQSILMNMPINGAMVSVPHVTSNTLTKLKT